jgi:hypothetical protein
MYIQKIRYSKGVTEPELSYIYPCELGLQPAGVEWLWRLKGPIMTKASGFFGLLTSILLLLATPAFAAHELEPGLWQDTETGTENGQPAKPEVTTNCLSAEEARDPIKTILKDADGKKCEALSAKENGNVVTVVMRCGDPKEMRIEIDMTVNFLSARSYTGTMKSLVIFGGQKMTTEKTLASKWIAASCKK